MKKILILYAHPAKTKSKINRTLMESVEYLKNVTVHDLYSTYPDFMIDVKTEQKLCEEHDIIIFQFPFYWYSSPSILKEWQDLVLEHSWAYGSKGNALKGKHFMISTTAGSDDQSYSPQGSNKCTFDELLSPFRAMTNLCKMNWIPPFTITGIHRGLPLNDLRIYTSNFFKYILYLRDEEIDYDKIKTCGNYTGDIEQLRKVVDN